MTSIFPLPTVRHAPFKVCDFTEIRIQQARQLAETIYDKYGGPENLSILSNKSNPTEMKLDDVMVILNPLLQRDPNNLRAREVIAFAKKTLGIKDSQ